MKKAIYMIAFFFACKYCTFDKKYYNMAIYDTCISYIKCAQDTKDKIDRIDAIIEALEDAELNSAIQSGDVDEYSLDDGQTRIKTVIRGPEAIEKAITALERRKQRIINRCVGYRYGLQDGKVINQ
jgi:hypothetical protein